MPLTVVGWNDLKSGLPGEAERIGSIHVGDVIAAVNNERTEGFTRRQVMTKILLSGRPLELTFVSAQVSHYQLVHV